MRITIFDVMKLYNDIPSKVYVLLRSILLPLNKIEEYIPKKGKIIDVGCGHGSQSIYLALKEKEREIIGLDLNMKRIEAAKNASSKIRNIKFFVKDLTKDASLENADSIILIDLLHHIPYSTQKKLFEECYNKLKKGGKIIIKDIADKPRWKYCYNYMHDTIISRESKLFCLKPNDLKEILTKFKFKIVLKPVPLKLWPLHPVPHFVIIGQK